MPGVSSVSSGPQVGNKLGAESAIKAQKDTFDQVSLKSTIKRVNNIRSKYAAVPDEGQRLASRIHEKGNSLTSIGAERAQQLRTLVDESISGSQKNSSQAVAGKTALVQARSSLGSAESGKGGSINSMA